MKVAQRSASLSLVYRPIRTKGEGPRGPRSRHSRPDGESFRTGERVKQSGIYEVIHDGDHRTAHDVVMLAGDLFPPCETCDERVRFQLVRTAPYIFQDDDFEEDK